MQTVMFVILAAVIFVQASKWMTLEHRCWACGGKGRHEDNCPKGGT